LSRSTTPNEKTKKQVSIDAKETKKERKGRIETEKKEVKKVFAPRKFSRRSKFRKRRKRVGELYFGPLVECK
jgi:hypothetical protein